MWLVHHDVSKMGNGHLPLLAIYHFGYSERTSKAINFHKRVFGLVLAVIPNEIPKCGRCLKQDKSNRRMGQGMKWSGGSQRNKQ